jgi:hypothetical protein
MAATATTALRALLVRRNEELLRNMALLTDLLQNAQVLPEAKPYQQYLLSRCIEQLRNAALKNLAVLQLKRDDVLDDVLSDTRVVISWAHRWVPRLVSPVLRSSESDRLCLSIISWMHKEHRETSVYPPAFVDGTAAIWPFTSFAPVYVFPSVEQRGLLYLPLLFHEKGHLLYNCHQPEMDDLVAELQRAIANALIPLNLRNDRHEEQQVLTQKIVVHTWYDWIQELFCDTVGLTIGGPCFLEAFASYLGTLTSSDFHLPKAALAHSSHPPTWLRVQMLAERAVEVGYTELAVRVQCEWRELAYTLVVEEDYYGYYQDSMADMVRSTIDDMLVEASPREHTAAQAQGGAWDPHTDSPVRLLNWAWQLYEANADSYPQWEKEQIRILLDS